MGTNASAAKWQTIQKTLTGSPVDAVEQIISTAMVERVSDVHLEPFALQARLRFRIDGVLLTVAEFSRPQLKQIIARLKVLAEIDIAETRKPQDGRISFNQSHIKLDIRLSVCPSVDGEKCVLRLNSCSETLLKLEQLGFLPEQLSIVISQLKKKQGLILLTGPTGCGKSSTIYSFLDWMNDGRANIVTAEDPVEKKIPGIHQVQIQSNIDINFASALRMFLRQDPDVMMIGEIRDKETASIAIRAAQTGHMVMSTIHAGSAVKVFSRLEHLGIKPELIDSVLSLVVAQLLVKVPCQFCNASIKNKHSRLGCEHCYEGYQGRTGIFEVLDCTNLLTSFKRQQSFDHSELLEQALRRGFLPLKIVGQKKVQQNQTTQAEINKLFL